MRYSKFDIRFVNHTSYLIFISIDEQDEIMIYKISLLGTKTEIKREMNESAQIMLKSGSLHQGFILQILK